MILGLLAASSLAAAPVPARPNASLLSDASQAIDAGRLEEAKLLIGRAVSAGASGVPVDRMVAKLAFASHTPFLITAAARAKLDTSGLPAIRLAAMAAGNLERWLGR